MARVEKSGLRVDETLANFISDRALPGSGVDPQRFWDGLSQLLHEFGPRNRALLDKRDELQLAIDAWHIGQRGKAWHAGAYRDFLTEIGYLVPEAEAFQIETPATDPEFASVAGPQLVVPITNARYALNAANARWGSLYDALYGTDAMGDLPQGKGYDAQRGARVIAWGRDFLDGAAPLAEGSWAGIDGLSVKDGALIPALRDGAKFAGHIGDAAKPSDIFLKNNGLLIRITVNASTPVGGQDNAGISDIVLESALSAIIDCEDSVACVDGEDKTLAYANWLGLMDGSLTESVEKGGKTFTRSLNPDVTFTGPDGADVTVKGRSLMLVRNVGHLMTTPAVLDRDGNEVFEGLLDAMVTALCSMRDLAKTGPKNSVTGS
ncbi:malate synthase G, partial [Paracoccus laeviglucosivorans]